MKHRNLLLRLVVVTFIFALNASYATAQQQSHRIKSIYRTYRGEPDLNFYLHYLEDGRISKAETEHLSYGDRECVEFVYDDANETISMSSNNGYNVKSNIKLQDGRISSFENFTDGGSSGIETEHCAISYDAQNRVSKIENNDGGNKCVSSVEWTDGNLTKIVDATTFYDDRVSYYEYTDYPNPKSNILFSPLFEDFDAFYIPIPNNYLSNLMGVKTKHLPKSFTRTYDYGDPRHEDYSYVFDEYGNISEIVVYDSDYDGEYFHFWITYETFVDTSVSGLKDDSREPVAYYNSLGQKVEKPEKGMNIIRYSDNSVKKVVIR